MNGLARLFFALLYLSLVAASIFSIHFYGAKYYSRDVERNINITDAGKSDDNYELHVCNPLDSTLNFEHMSQMIGRTVTRETFKDEATVDEILRSLPSESMMIKQCKDRNPDSLKPMDIHGRQVCMEHYLEAYKYITSDRACYSFFLIKNNNPVSDHSISFSYYEPSVKRSIIFNTPYWSTSSDFLVFNVLANDIPLRYFRTAARGQVKVGKEHNKRFGIRTQRITTKNLPPPYVSRCQMYDRTATISLCEQEKLFNETGRYPTSAYLRGGSGKLISDAWMSVRDNALRYKEITMECEAKYGKERECDETSLLTTIDEKRETEDGKPDDFEIYTLVPVRPNIEVMFDIISAVFLIWGFSCLGCLPIDVGNEEYDPEGATVHVKMFNYFKIYCCRCGKIKRKPKGAPANGTGGGANGGADPEAGDQVITQQPSAVALRTPSPHPIKRKCAQGKSHGHRSRSHSAPSTPRVHFDPSGPAIVDGSQLHVPVASGSSSGLVRTISSDPETGFVFRIIRDPVASGSAQEDMNTAPKSILKSPLRFINHDGAI